MAVGDIVQFGTLKLNDTLYAQRPSVYALVPDENEFTFVDTVEDKKWDWIEFTIDGKKTYICKTLAVSNVKYDYFLKYEGKKFIIDNKTYLFKVLTNDKTFLESIIPTNIADKIDFQGYNNYPACMILKGVIKTSHHGDEGLAAGYWTSNSASKAWQYQRFSIDGYSGTDVGILPILQLLNNSPVISEEDSNLGNKTSNFSIAYSVNDNDVADELTVNEKLNGDIIRTLKNPVKGKELTLTISEERFANLSVNSTNTIEIEVTDGQATTYRRYTFVKTNSAPFITYTGQADLGELTTKPSITYSVKDNEGDAITVTEKLNGEVINQFSATSNTNYTVGITDTFWLTCGSNTNTVEIIASDALGGSSSKTITFSRKITKLQIVMKNAIETDAKATKILVSPQWTTTGGVGKVEVCNNGFDSNPKWEDATTMVVLNRPYLFTNTSKTASKWGIKIRITVTKNQGYDGEVAIFGFGGAYE